LSAPIATRNQRNFFSYDVHSASRFERSSRNGAGGRQIANVTRSIAVRNCYATVVKVLNDVIYTVRSLRKSHANCRLRHVMYRMKQDVFTQPTRLLKSPQVSEQYIGIQSSCVASRLIRMAV